MSRQIPSGLRPGRGVAAPAVVLLVSLCVGPALQDVPGRVPELASSNSGEDLSRLRALHSRREWMALAEAARSARTTLARGSDGWFEVSALLAEALYESWIPAELEALGRDVLTAVMESAGARPGEPFDVLARLSPAARPHTLDAYVLAAWAKQGLGDHEGALALLSGVSEIVHHGHVRASPITQRAGLDLGRSLLALGREQEGRAALTTVRDRFPGNEVAALAMVILESGKEGASAYRGKYEGDERHARRMAGLRRAIPAARKRVVLALELDEDDLPAILIGVADLPLGHPVELGYTEGDPRRPDLPPLILVASEALALDLQDPEQTLTHELSHAALLHELGLRYEAVPAWAREGLSNWVAEESGRIVTDFLGQRLLSDPAAFLGSGFEALVEPRFESEENAPALEAGLALQYLEEQPGPGGISRLLKELRGGRSFEEALRVVSELSLDGFLSKARRHVLRLFSEARQEALTDLEELERGRRGGVEPALKAAEGMLRRDPPPLVLAFARHMRAECLGLLGRHQEEAAAYGEMALDSRSFAPHAEDVRLKRVRALIADARLSEAQQLLRDLRRDALGLGTRKEAERLLAALRE